MSFTYQFCLESGSNILKTFYLTDKRIWDVCFDKYREEPTYMVGNSLITVSDFGYKYKISDISPKDLNNEIERRHPGWLQSGISIPFEEYLNYSLLQSIMSSRYLDFGEIPELSLNNIELYIIYLLLDKRGEEYNLLHIEALYYYTQNIYLLKDKHLAVLLSNNNFGIEYYKTNNAYYSIQKSLCKKYGIKFDYESKETSFPFGVLSIDFIIKNLTI
jgi:hypothetical protein